MIYLLLNRLRKCIFCTRKPGEDHALRSSLIQSVNKYLSYTYTVRFLNNPFLEFQSWKERQLLSSMCSQPFRGWLCHRFEQETVKSSSWVPRLPMLAWNFLSRGIEESSWRVNRNWQGRQYSRQKNGLWKDVAMRTIKGSSKAIEHKHKRVINSLKVLHSSSHRLFVGPRFDEPSLKHVSLAPWFELVAALGGGLLLLPSKC